MENKKKKKSNRYNRNRRLQNITISLPNIYDKNLQYLKKLGIISSRSEGIREAIREFLERENYNAELFGFKSEQEMEE